MYNVSYIITRKINTDVVENLYSYLKGMCGATFNNIIALQFKYLYVIKLIKL